MARPSQRIVVFQQRGSGEEKIRGVREHGRGVEIARVIDIDDELPPVIDDPERYLPQDFHQGVDLVLDHLRHPDLTHALALRCAALGLPIIASGRRVPVAGLIAPPTCCGLARTTAAGPYAAQFGLPAYQVTLREGRIAGVQVQRGAPCGATWDGAARIVGLTVEEALTRVGLETQLYCKADPSGWDPIHGQSPVHFAGRVHARALERAIQRAGEAGEPGPGAGNAAESGPDPQARKD